MIKFFALPEGYGIFTRGDGTYTPVYDNSKVDVRPGSFLDALNAAS